MAIIISLFFCQLVLLAENHANWQIAGILVVDGGSGCCHHGCCHHSSDSWQQPPTLCAVSSSCRHVVSTQCPSHRHVVMSARQRRLVATTCLLVVMSPPPRRFATFVVATSPLHRRETILHRLSRLSYKIQQMILEQSFQESFQVFLLKAHRHNFGECVGGGNVVSICIIIMTLLSISLQTLPAKPASSWCKAPTLWCLLRKVQTCPAHSCPSDTYLLNLASLQVQGRFSSWSWYGGGYHASNQHEDSLTFVVEDISIIIVTIFLHKSRQSTNLPCSMCMNMLHDHLVDVSPIHVCWCLHFSELLAGIVSSSKNLSPLQLVHHSIAAASLLLINVRLPAIGAKVIDLLSSPLGSQSPSKWKILHQHLLPQLMLGL